MPALKVDLLEVFFTAAIWLLLCRAIESRRAVVPPYGTAFAKRLLSFVRGPMHRYFGLALGRLPGARTYPPGRH